MLKYAQMEKKFEIFLSNISITEYVNLFNLI